MSAKSDEHVEHLSTLLCRQVERADNGALSAIGLIDMLAVDNLPSEGVAVAVDFYVLSSWRRNKQPGCKIRQRLVFERDENKHRVILTPPNEIDLSQVHLSSLITSVPLVPLEGYGQYFFVVQRETPAGEWEDARPSAGLWIAPTNWRMQASNG